MCPRVFFEKYLKISESFINANMFCIIQNRGMMLLERWSTDACWSMNYSLVDITDGAFSFS